MAEKNNQPLTLWVSQTIGFLITNALLLISYTIIRIAYPIHPRLLPVGYLIIGLGLGVIWVMLGGSSAKIEKEGIAGPAKTIRTLLCRIIPILVTIVWLVALIVLLAAQ